MQLDKDLARRRFSRAARSYNKWCLPQEKMADKLLSMLDREPVPTSILEIGCGTGILTGRLAQIYPSAAIVALDVAEGMIDECRRQWSSCDNLSLMVADAESLCLNERFDLIVSNSCFQWMSDLPATISRCAQHLTPRGLLAFSAPSSGTLRELQLSYCAATDGGYAGHRLPDPKEYTQAVTQSGLCMAEMIQETLVLDYAQPEEAIVAVREIGAARAVRDGNPGLTRSQAERMMDYYRENFSTLDGRVTCTYSMVYAKARL